MRLYHFSFTGEALGGVAVVLAEHATGAKQFLMKTHPDLKDVTLDRIEELKNETQEVYFWDGDY